ncbi:MAG: hypothetical protein NZM37_00500 [Sandaracinaceae bacterium]|nr:hypothetical protein [Sandaracinaceae bacterium]
MLPWRLLRESACSRARAWRLELDGIGREEWIETFSPWEEESGIRGLRSYSIPPHRVLYVEASSRIQIRIGVEVPAEERQREAEKVAAWIVRRILARRGGITTNGSVE